MAAAGGVRQPLRRRRRGHRQGDLLDAGAGVDGRAGRQGQAVHPVQRQRRPGGEGLPDRDAQLQRQRQGARLEQLRHLGARRALRTVIARRSDLEQLLPARGLPASRHARRKELSGRPRSRHLRQPAGRRVRQGLLCGPRAIRPPGLHERHDPLRGCRRLCDDLQHGAVALGRLRRHRHLDRSRWPDRHPSRRRAAVPPVLQPEGQRPDLRGRRRGSRHRRRRRWRIVSGRRGFGRRRSRRDRQVHPARPRR